MEQKYERGRPKGSANKKTTKKKAKQPEQSVELQYALHLLKQKTFARVESITHEWNGKCWQALKVDDTIRRAWEWLVTTSPKQVSKNKAESCANSATVPMNELFVNNDYKRAFVPCNSYMLEIKHNGELIQHKHSKGFNNTYVINADLPADESDAKLFKAFIETSLPDPEVRGLVQEYVGYTLLPDCRFEVGQFWHGEGSNGKSVLAQLVSALHGNGVRSARLDKLSGFGLQDIIGATLVACDETPSKGIDDQTIKTLISGNPVLVDRKNRDPLTLRISAKWIVNTNTVPHTEQSHAWWRRWHIIHWDTVIPDEAKIHNLTEKIIENELGYVLKWSIEGLQRLLKRGSFNVPQSVANHKDKFAEMADSAKAYLSDFDMHGSADGSVKSSVYNKYKEWCSENGMRPLNSSNFWTRVGSIAKAKGIVAETFRRGSEGRRINLVFIEKNGDEEGGNDCVPF